MNELVIIYGFVGKDGEEDTFTTTDPEVAENRAESLNLTVIERIYEYKYSRPAERPVPHTNN